MERKDTDRSPGAILSIAAILVSVQIWPGRAIADTDGDQAVPELGTLEVRVTGFKSDQGRLAIALFADAEAYSTQSNAVRRAWLEIENGESVWTVDQLPEGEYALIAYQDLNGNEEIDMRVLGMPKEPVGVSNDARGLFGPPRFKAAKFEFSAPLTFHQFRLR